MVLLLQLNIFKIVRLKLELTKKDNGILTESRICLRTI